jgi:hypothetical protein
VNDAVGSAPRSCPRSRQATRGEPSRATGARCVDGQRGERSVRMLVVLRAADRTVVGGLLAGTPSGRPATAWAAKSPLTSRSG